MANLNIQFADAFPAHAGMNRTRSRSWWAGRCVPRTRGDEPVEVKLLISM